MSAQSPNMQAVVVCQWPKLNRLVKLIRRQGIGHGVAAVSQAPVPRLGDRQILVGVHSVALNPTDFKHIDFVSPAGSIIGCDYAGTVKQIGKNVKPGSWRVGDRVAGAMHGNLYPDRGTFAEFLVIDADLAWKIPDGVGYREAATFGVSALSAMMALNHILGVPWPDDEKHQKAQAEDSRAPTILIYAGSTGSGLLALQLAKLGGHQAITTCSPRNFDLVKRYGATAAYDYNSPTAVEEIRKRFPGIKIALDCFSEGQSTSFCQAAMSSEGGKIVNLNGSTAPSRSGNFEIQAIMAYTLMGLPFQLWAPLGPKFPAVPEDRAAAARMTKILPDLIQSGDLIAPPMQVLEGGWEAILPGLDLLRQGKVSGKKLVVDLKYRHTNSWGSNPSCQPCSHACCQSKATPKRPTLSSRRRNAKSKTTSSLELLIRPTARVSVYSCSIRTAHLPHPPTVVFLPPRSHS